MKRQQMAIATGVRAWNRRSAVAAVATQAQTAFEQAERVKPAPSEASFVPASIGLREHTLILTGELNGASAHALEAEIERLCEEGVTSITLDLRELTYIDSVGVAVIAFRCGLCQRRGYEFALIPGARKIHRVFEQAGVAGLLPFQDDSVEAPPAPALLFDHRPRASV
jgi:anti-anti-sigma factor